MRACIMVWNSAVAISRWKSQLGSDFVRCKRRGKSTHFCPISWAFDDTFYQKFISLEYTYKLHSLQQLLKAESWTKIYFPRQLHQWKRNWEIRTILIFTKDFVSSARRFFYDKHHFRLKTLVTACGNYWLVAKKKWLMEYLMSENFQYRWNITLSWLQYSIRTLLSYTRHGFTVKTCFDWNSTVSLASWNL